MTMSLGTMNPGAPRRRFDLGVYLVTDPHLCAARGLEQTVLAAVHGGATLVQLRDKQASEAELIATGQRLRAALAGSGVPLIVNDRLEVALAIGADGLHLGQADGALAAARARLGATAILGLSVQTVAQARAVDPTLVDYVGVGPVSATATKPDHAAPLGLAGLAQVCAASPVPAVAIGGLTLADVAAVLAAGASGLALVSAICAAADPTTATRAFAQALQAARAAGAAAGRDAPGPDASGSA